MEKLREVLDVLRECFPDDIDEAAKGSKSRVRRVRDAERRAGLEFLRSQGRSYKQVRDITFDALPTGIPSAGSQIGNNLKRISRDIKSGKDKAASAILLAMRTRQAAGEKPWEGGGGITRAEFREATNALDAAVARKTTKK